MTGKLGSLFDLSFLKRSSTSCSVLPLVSGITTLAKAVVRKHTPANVPYVAGAPIVLSIAGKTLTRQNMVEKATKTVMPAHGVVFQLSS